MISIRGSHVVLTGASSGIGRALAGRLAEEGANLTLLARDRGRLKSLVATLEAACPGNPTPRGITCDLRDHEAVRGILRESSLSSGPIHVLINNAGQSLYGDSANAGLADLREIMEVNYFAAVAAGLEVLPSMRAEGRGVIVNVASVAALYGVPFMTGYGASKAALANFSQGLRAELRGTGVRVLLVYPGYTDTNLFRREHRLGGARRPGAPYASADSVARQIVRALRKGRSELVLTGSGRALFHARALGTGMVDLAMAGIARRLRTGGEVDHGRA